MAAHRPFGSHDTGLFAVHGKRRGRESGPAKPVIGLAGGIGAGKSVVAQLFAQLGAGVIDADLLAHEELAAEEVTRTLAAWWGAEVLDAAGRVDRDRVGSIVFGDARERHRLEGLLHPRIRERSRGLMAQMEGDPAVRAIVIDAPLLIETGLDEVVCDVVVFVEADEAVRQARAAASRGWSAQEHRRREAAQKPLDLKRSKADYTVSNNSTTEALRRRVEEVFAEILSGHRTETR